MLSKTDVTECMALAVAVFPQFPLERVQIDAYYELLKDLDCSKADLFEAVKSAIRVSSFFPTIALIREEVKGHQTWTPKAFNPAIDAPQGVPMPEYVKKLRDDLKEQFPSHPVAEAFGDFIESSRIAPNSDSASVEKSPETV